MASNIDSEIFGQNYEYNKSNLDNYNNYNLGNIDYDFGTNNYSSNTHNEEIPQNYNQYFSEENQNLFTSDLTPHYNTNSVNVNSYSNQNFTYGIDNTTNDLMNYTYSENNSTINMDDIFNAYTTDKNYPKYTIQRKNTADNLTISMKFRQNHQDIYNAKFNDEEPIHKLDLVNNNKQSLQLSNLGRKNFEINNRQKNKNIQVEEIISNNYDKEYYRKNSSGLIVDYAYCEEPNSENRDYMEDRGKSVENFNKDPNKILFCVFDGHGGEQASQFLQDNFHIYFKRMIPFKQIFEDIIKLFKLLDEKIKLLNLPDVGSTGTIVFIEKVNNKRILYCANCGDSRCVLVNRKGIMRMSHDDRVDDKQENQRVISQGGVIDNGRVGGILMLTRSFGDWGIKEKGLIVKPHILKIELNEDDLYLIIASDGLWDVIEDEECKGFTEIYESTYDTCKNFVKESLNRGSTDNISCFVIKLN